MVAGTASDVGKSVVTTALCRVLAEEGFRVAPFKAQNMSLNAGVTDDGREIGRAQAAQAEAAGVAARVEMNPILLKPESDGCSQLVVLGRAVGRVEARDYWRRRSDLWPVVTQSLRVLRREYDVVVIEGAGAAVELNLRHADVANLRLAVHARAAVILVGDIERGGVFAQLLGTLDLMRPAERRLVRWLLVNRFRGDPDLFAAGVSILERRSGLPVLGVLPYAQNLGVPAEDSMALDREPASVAGGPDIAVVRYPHISNFDDFTPLAAAGAAVRFTRTAANFGVPDLVVLPGSKTTIGDLDWLRRSGVASRIRALADAGVPVLGICGGFQMLGHTVSDPTGVEGPPRTIAGLNLLDVETTMTASKQTFQVDGTFATDTLLGQAGDTLAGYELHVGETDSRNVRPFARLRRRPSLDEVNDGAVSPDGLVLGTYLHGLFGNERVRNQLFQVIAHRRGVPFDVGVLPQDPFAALSSWFRAHADVAAIGSLLRSARRG